MWIAMAADYETSGEVTAAPILLLGDSRLRQVFVPVTDFMDPAFVSNQRRLHATLAAFRRANGLVAPSPLLRLACHNASLHSISEMAQGLLVNPEIVLGQPIDHLDGILAVDRVLDDESLVMREVFEAQRAYFVSQVDYVIAV